MDEEDHELLITLSLSDGDQEELAELTGELRSELADLDVDSIENVSLGEPPEGAKAADWVAIGQMVVTLAPVVIPPVFAAVKSWIERKPSVPVKVRIKLGKKISEIEYDPTRTSAEELDRLVKTLGKTLK